MGDDGVGARLKRSGEQRPARRVERDHQEEGISGLSNRLSNTSVGDKAMSGAAEQCVSRQKAT